MSTDFIARMIGMVVIGISGTYWGTALGLGLPDAPATLYSAVLGLLGALVGLILTPYFTTRPTRSIRALLAKTEATTLLAGLSGLIVGLLISALLAFPLSLLPSPFGKVLPFIGVLIFTYFGIAIFVMRQRDIFSLFRDRLLMRDPAQESGSAASPAKSILMDTSVIIDGRILDIARTGFLNGTLLIPRFVLNELQYIADSADGLRRQRGRRGMEILSQLQKEPRIPVQISDMDVEGTREVDDKLVILARQMKSPILTNDYNLNRVAELQGVTVLNINELANSVKAVLLPGEALKVNIIQEGREHGQGVGYLDDGTMVVIEDGVDFLHKEIDVTVTKVLQTAAGRMIFARPEENRK
jgi:uncharacterized protein YacL